jgi:hypothetical protein
MKCRIANTIQTHTVLPVMVLALSPNKKPEFIQYMSTKLKSKWNLLPSTEFMEYEGNLLKAIPKKDAFTWMNEHLPAAVSEMKKDAAFVEKLLSDLCVAYTEAQLQKPIKQQEDTKYQDWKRRRDEGNRKELQRRKEEKERLAETLKAHNQRQMESHWESMQPTWNKQYNEILEKRRFEVTFLGIEAPSGLIGGGAAMQMHRGV